VSILSACYRNSTLGFLAHVFHAGDVRIYRVNVKHLEQLTKDHRLWFDEYKSYLNRALGIDSFCEIDYQHTTLLKGDVFVLATAGLYEELSQLKMTSILH
jgi:serine/threonine protein phosphatase PrpC